VVADVDRAQLWVLSADRLSAQSVSLQSGDEPGRVIEGPTGKVYVALRRAGAILELDVATLGTRRLTTCAQPRGLAWDGARLVVACLGGELERVEPVDGQRHGVVATAPWGDLRDVVVDGDRLLVAAEGDLRHLDGERPPDQVVGVQLIAFRRDRRGEVGHRVISALE
jgi:hypothetical protein